jgi:hypothetical protein
LAVAEWRGYSAIGRNVSVKSSNEPIKNFWFHLKEATKLDCPVEIFLIGGEARLQSYAANRVARTWIFSV